MEYRSLGRSGLKVSVLSFGAGTFGGAGPLFSAWGTTDVSEARRLIDICVEAGVNLFDTADVYSNGASEEVLGAALEGRRETVLISTKTSLPMGDGPNDAGSSRFRLIRSVEDALRRLRTDYIDILQLHAYDARTPVEEVLSTLDMLVRAGKVRYVGISNFSGWEIMKSLAVADTYGWPRYIANQVYYSLLGRDYEWDLMPLGMDQGLGALVCSSLGWGGLRERSGAAFQCRKAVVFTKPQALVLRSMRSISTASLMPLKMSQDNSTKQLRRWRSTGLQAGPRCLPLSWERETKCSSGRTSERSVGISPMIRLLSWTMRAP